jgi:hypothetical protein
MFAPTLHMVGDVDQCTSLVSPQLLCVKKNIAKKSDLSLQIGNKILIPQLTCELLGHHDA